MQAAENSYDSVEFLVNFIIIELFKSFFEFIIAVQSNIMWSSITLVHKILERLISIFLELHIIGESLLDQIIHLSFEL